MVDKNCPCIKFIIANSFCENGSCGGAISVTGESILGLLFFGLYRVCGPFAFSIAWITTLVRRCVIYLLVMLQYYFYHSVPQRPSSLLSCSHGTRRPVRGGFRVRLLTIRRADVRPLCAHKFRHVSLCIPNPCHDRQFGQERPMQC